MIERAVFLHENNDVLDICEAWRTGGIIRLQCHRFYDQPRPDRHRGQSAGRACGHLQKAATLDVVDVVDARFSMAAEWMSFAPEFSAWLLQAKVTGAGMVRRFCGQVRVDCARALCEGWDKQARILQMCRRSEVIAQQIRRRCLRTV